jgi:uncharacterized membrane protein
MEFGAPGERWRPVELFPTNVKFVKIKLMMIITIFIIVVSPIGVIPTIPTNFDFHFNFPLQAFQTVHKPHAIHHRYLR